MVPPDIVHMIAKQFPSTTDKNTVLELIKSQFAVPESVLVGPVQFSRAMLVLSNGNIDSIRELAAPPHDSRDIVCLADRISKTPGDYFRQPFNFEDCG